MTPLGGPVLTADQTKDAEAAAACGLTELMNRAGKVVADAVTRFGGGAPVLVLCGPGNNGGDGYVAARLLRERGLRVRVASLREPRAKLALAARALWTGPVEPVMAAEPSAIVVDALFGTGLARPLEAESVDALRRLRTAAQFTLAVDVPSGVGTDDGQSLGAIGADLTLALGCLKPAHVLQPAASLCGRVMVADIGIPAKSNVSVLKRPCLVAPGADAHKYRRGLAAIVGGDMPGAAMLAAQAAMRVSGYVVVTDNRGGPAALVERAWSEIAADARTGAVLIGPGLGRTSGANAKLQAALGSVHPLVLDADALHLLSGDDLARLRTRSSPVILTPHAGEFAAMFGLDGGSKIDQAREAAARSGATITFKGADTAIATPDGRVSISAGAPGWLASAGTGDVLAGIATGLLAGGMAPFEAAQAAVWLQAEAARIAGPALIADELPAHLPAAIATCL